MFAKPSQSYRAKLISWACRGLAKRKPLPHGAPFRIEVTVLVIVALGGAFGSFGRE